STADLALILVDARKGILTQTRRHSYLVSLLGIRNVVVVINKMDLVAYSQDLFTRLDREYREFAVQIGLDEVTCIPTSAVHGHNVVGRCPETAWYSGPTLLEFLDTVQVGRDEAARPFRLPIQYVLLPDLPFRGVAGAPA